MAKGYSGRMPHSVLYPAAHPHLLRPGSAVIVCAPNKYAGRTGKIILTGAGFARVQFDKTLVRWVKLGELRVKGPE